MDLSWFKDLDNLNRTGNFTQAARLANISQPAFSRRIKALETWVGAPLVDRSHQPVSLTVAGRQMLEVGRQAVTRLEVERAHVREALALPDKYVVSFGAQHSIGWRFYPDWLQAFEGGYGPIMSRLRADDLPNCIEDLKQGVVDFVIAYVSKFADVSAGLPAVESLVIGYDELIPICKCDSDGAPLYNLDDCAVASFPYLRFGDNAPIGQHIEPLLTSSRIRNRLHTVYENSMAGALRIRTRNGSGIAWLPRSLVKPDLEAGLVTLAGNEAWFIELEIRLHRIKGHTNQLTRKIWSYLAMREAVPLLGPKDEAITRAV